MPDHPSIQNSTPKPPYRLVVFWKEDLRTKKAFLQYKEVQVIRRGGESSCTDTQPRNLLGGKSRRAEGKTLRAEENAFGSQEFNEGAYVFYPLLLSEKLEELILRWNEAATMAEALELREAAITEAQELFDEALEASDNPHCEIFAAQTALNHLTTLDLLFNVIFFADQLPLFFDQAAVAKAQQTGAFYIWLDPYLAGISKRVHKPLDTEEALWPAKEEPYCYFKRKSDPTVSPQQLANLWRTNASRILEIDSDCRQKLWAWLKGRKFSEEEIRALILP